MPSFLEGFFIDKNGKNYKPYAPDIIILRILLNPFGEA